MSPHLHWRCVVRSGSVGIWEGTPSASRGSWVCYEVRDEASGAVRALPEKDTLQAFSEMIHQQQDHQP